MPKEAEDRYISHVLKLSWNILAACKDGNLAKVEACARELKLISFKMKIQRRLQGVAR